jgi:hypothetical protein
MSLESLLRILPLTILLKYWVNDPLKSFRSKKKKNLTLYSQF